MAVLFFVKYFHDETCDLTYVNPQRCETDVAFSNPDYDPVRSRLAGYIAQEKVHGLASASVYFRDLRNGPTFFIGVDDTYIGASLLKLPILLQYLKEAESSPEILDARITANVDPKTVNQGLPTNQTIQAGKQYTVRELLEYMIRYSDNNSRAALTSYYQTLHSEEFKPTETLESLGITNILNDEQGVHISVRSVASIFRILYNASYLNPERSQQALTWLTESRYDDGIAKPIPSHISVANKYGIYLTQVEAELHDCGIVYYPQHPYIICVMTKGKQVENLQQNIAHISDVVYQEVEARYGVQEP